METKKFHNCKLLRYGYTTGSWRRRRQGGSPAAPHGRAGGGSPDYDSPGGPSDPGGIGSGVGGGDRLLRHPKGRGDDPDATSGPHDLRHGAAHSGRRPIDGGPGVGRVTKPGLDQPVGAAAINHVPRQMIEEAVREVLGDAPGGLR